MAAGLHKICKPSKVNYMDTYYERGQALMGHVLFLQKDRRKINQEKRIISVLVKKGA